MTKGVMKLGVWTVGVLLFFAWMVGTGRCDEIDWAKPLAFHGGIHGADYWSSVTSNGVEVGPVASRAGLVPTKIGGFAITYLADVGIQKLQGPKRWPVRVYRGLLFVGYGWVVAHNRSVR